jgi:hypothetical protein
LAATYVLPDPHHAEKETMIALLQHSKEIIDRSLQQLTSKFALIK